MLLTLEVSLELVDVLEFEAIFSIRPIGRPSDPVAINWRFWYDSIMGWLRLAVRDLTLQLDVRKVTLGWPWSGAVESAISTRGSPGNSSRALERTRAHLSARAYILNSADEGV